MKRKVVLHGPSTLGISLPSTWINEEGIKKGDEIDIVEENNALIIRSSTKKPFRDVIAELSNSHNLVKRILIKMYHEGYDKITLKFNKPELIKPIREVIFDELVGFEIIEQTSSSCVIKDLSGKGEEDYGSFMKRLFILTDSMLNDGLKSIKEKDSAMLNAVREREFDIDRITNICIRQLAKNNNLNIIDYLTAYHLEAAADCYYRLTGNVISKKFKVDDEFIDFHADINNFFSALYDFVLTPSLELGVIVAKQYEKLKIGVEHNLFGSKDRIRAILILDQMILNLIGIQNVRLGTLFGQKNYDNSESRRDHR